MDNKVHEAVKNICTYMKEINNIVYQGFYVKHTDPLLYKITFEGTNQRKIVIELLENGNICVLQTIDVVYNELSVFMNKFMELLRD
jgi:hypothetical protein